MVPWTNSSPCNIETISSFLYFNSCLYFFIYTRILFLGLACMHAWAHARTPSEWLNLVAHHHHCGRWEPLIDRNDVRIYFQGEIKVSKIHNSLVCLIKLSGITARKQLRVIICQFFSIFSTLCLATKYLRSKERLIKS